MRTKQAAGGFGSRERRRSNFFAGCCSLPPVPPLRGRPQISCWARSALFVRLQQLGSSGKGKGRGRGSTKTTGPLGSGTTRCTQLWEPNAQGPGRADWDPVQLGARCLPARRERTGPSGSGPPVARGVRRAPPGGRVAQPPRGHFRWWPWASRTELDHTSGEPIPGGDKYLAAGCRLSRAK